MSALHELIHDLKHAINAAIRAWRDARWCRNGGCPDDASF